MKGPSRGEVFDELSNWNVGAGIVTMALFPLALPGIILLLVAAIPLLALAIPFLLIGGLLVGIARLARSLARMVEGLRRSARTEGELMRIAAPHGS